jgi:23S rRNA (cytosine1962-C5)-methyltransferase
VSALLRLPVPPVSDRRVAVRLAPDALRQVRGGHPWVFDRSIRSTSHDAAAGDLAVVFDERRRFVALGLWDPGSPLRMRVLHRERSVPVDEAFWRARVAAALERRRDLVASADGPIASRTTAYRCLHGEGDGVPGLVVDRYEGTLVAKLYTTAWLPHLPAVLAPLVEMTQAERVVVRLSRRVQAETSIVRDGDVVLGAAVEGAIPFVEHGLAFTADVVRGQKTGHFLDQRDTRALVARLASGARVLDVFSSTGGFTVHAAAGGARSVLSVDLSPHAIAACIDNVERNRDRPSVVACRHRTTAGDAFDVMAALGASGARFDVVIVDPPSFASKQADIEGAVRAYRRLTRLAVPLIEPGGVLVQSSCSSRVVAERFFAAVLEEARAAAPVHEEGRFGQPVDHPVGIPETAYLKTIVLRVARRARAVRHN